MKNEKEIEVRGRDVILHLMTFENWLSSVQLLCY